MKKNKGISLMSLILTIIVIIILASVTISYLVGEKSIISKAQFASDLLSDSQKKDSFLALELDTFMPYNTTIQNLNYTESTSTIINPDRWFYSYCTPLITDSAPNYEQVNISINDALSHNHSLLHLRFDLKNYRDRDLTSNSIDNINGVFSLIRENNLKAIVRFSYDYEGIGNREPSSIIINLRKPSMYRAIISSEPISKLIAHTNSDASRVGIFNDGSANVTIPGCNVIKDNKTIEYKIPLTSIQGIENGLVISDIGLHYQELPSWQAGRSAYCTNTHTITY